MSNRLAHISFLQSYGIILVVLGHSTYQLGHAGLTPWVNLWVYQFHMPLFFFISGYLLSYGCERRGISPAQLPLGKFMWGKMKRLLLPYIVLNTVAYLPKTLVSGMALRPVDFSLTGYLHMLLYPADNVIAFMWFLPALFMVFVMFMIIVRTPLERHLPLTMAALVVAGIVVPFHRVALLYIGTSCIYLVFFIFGYYFRQKNIDEFVELYAERIASMAVGPTIVMMFMPDFSVRFYLGAFIGIMMSVALSRIYLKRGYHFIDHLNGASYTIYLLSWFPQVASQQMLMHFVPGIPWPVTTTLAILTGLYIPLAVYRLTMNHLNNKAVRFLAPAIGIQLPRK